MLIRTSDEAIYCLRAVASADVVAVDTETTGLHPYEDDYLTGISVSTREGSWYWPVAHAPSDVPNRDPGPLLAALTGKRQVWHHALFDWAMLAKHGFVPSDDFYDTQVASWLADENLPKGLKERAAFLWGEDAADEKRALRKLFHSPKAGGQGKTWATVTAEDIGAYAAKDTELTLRLYDHYGDMPGLQRELDVQRVLDRMIATGIRVDPDAIARQHDAAHETLRAIEAEFDGTLLTSPKQVAALVYDTWGLDCLVTTKTGGRSVSVEALEAYVGHPGVGRILEYRRLAKACSGYYLPLTDRIGADGRIHPWFSSTRTVTGRLSCSSPNLMTIPRDDTLVGVRDVFVPADGMELWEYDLKAAELRVMASWAGEAHIVDALAGGRDLHSETAEAVFGPGYTGLQRRIAKSLNFGFCYGIGPRRLASYLVKGQGEAVGKAHVDEAARILARYADTYPNVTRLMRGLEAVARRDGIIPLHKEGRYRHFRSPGRQVDYFTALNAIVQGGVGEFMKDVMLAVDPAWRMLLQVHDSLVFEVPPGQGPVLQSHLQTIADDINPFRMRMEWEGKQW